MIIFVIPAYNEECNIGSLLERIQELGHNPQAYKVLVINDGSQDRTVEVAQSFRRRIPLEVISHPVNQGVDQVFRTGFQAALATLGPEDIIVTLEADNTSDLFILQMMIKKIREGNDLVLASCYAPGGKVLGTTFSKKALSAGANILLKVFYPIRGVHTYSSFYRAYRAELLQHAYSVYGNNLIEEKGFVCMVEMLVKFSRLGINIAEVPMYLQGDLRKGSSKMKVVKTIWGYLHFIGRDQFSRAKGIIMKRAVSSFLIFKKPGA